MLRYGRGSVQRSVGRCSEERDARVIERVQEADLVGLVNFMELDLTLRGGLTLRTNTNYRALHNPSRRLCRRKSSNDAPASLRGPGYERAGFVDVEAHWLSRRL